ncbi:hypothetical protein IWX46DRAFT_580635 [Phyllosticta citricarpa]|uniref:Uncharacterized protein n=1 Tax=Phyllosticta citricarpa TaxID=55181 RepID=A0ABR1MEN5_9PEZI
MAQSPSPVGPRAFLCSSSQLDHHTGYRVPWQLRQSETRPVLVVSRGMHGGRVFGVLTAAPLAVGWLAGWLALTARLEGVPFCVPASVRRRRDGGWLPRTVNGGARWQIHCFSTRNDECQSVRPVFGLEVDREPDAYPRCQNTTTRVSAISVSKHHPHAIGTTVDSETLTAPTSTLRPFLFPDLDALLFTVAIERDRRVPHCFACPIPASLATCCAGLALRSTVPKQSPCAVLATPDAAAAAAAATATSLRAPRSSRPRASSACMASHGTGRRGADIHTYVLKLFRQASKQARPTYFSSACLSAYSTCRERGPDCPCAPPRVRRELPVAGCDTLTDKQPSGHPRSWAAHCHALALALALLTAPAAAAAAAAAAGPVCVRAQPASQPVIGCPFIIPATNGCSSMIGRSFCVCLPVFPSRVSSLPSSRVLEPGSAMSASSRIFSPQLRLGTPGTPWRHRHRLLGMKGFV